MKIHRKCQNYKRKRRGTNNDKTTPHIKPRTHKQKYSNRVTAVERSVGLMDAVGGGGVGVAAGVLNIFTQKRHTYIVNTPGIVTDESYREEPPTKRCIVTV